MAFCIVDSHPGRGNDMREAVAQKCSHAGDIADGREIWFKHD